MSYTPTPKETADALQYVDRIKRRAPRRAPARFDPETVTQFPRLEGWTIEKYPAGRCEVLTGTVWHHPHIVDGARVRTSALIWIDEDLGWARSLYRFYRLGRSQPADAQ
jgi:hypothetical protein